jgi:hypothetical protein
MDEPIQIRTINKIIWKILTESTGKPGNYTHVCGKIVLGQIVTVGDIKTEVPYCPSCEEKLDSKGPIPESRKIMS